MKTKLWPIIMAIALAIVLLPAPAEAGEPVKVGGFVLTCTNSEDTLLEKDYSYDEKNELLTIKTTKALTISTTGAVNGRISISLSSGDTATLTLDGVNIRARDNTAALHSMQANVILTLAEGKENTFTGGSSDSGDSEPGHGIRVYKNLTIKGKGQLTAIGGDGANGYFKGCGIYCKDNLTISDGATVAATGGTGTFGAEGIYCDEGDLSITNSNVTAQGGTSTGATTAGYGINCEDGAITITGSTVTATGGTGGNGDGGYGISCDDDIDISGSTVTATGGAGTGKYAYGGYGIVVYSDGEEGGFTISDSTVTATGGAGTGEYAYGGYGISCDDDITISANSTVTATGGDGTGTGEYGHGGYGIYCYEGNLSAPSGTITAIGGNGTGTAGAGGSGICMDLEDGDTANTITFGNAAVVTAAAGASGAEGAASVAAICSDTNAITNEGLLFDKDSKADVFTARIPDSGTLTPSNNFTVPDCALTIPATTTLTVGEGVTMTNEGTIKVEGTLEVRGSLEGSGTITLQPNATIQTGNSQTIVAGSEGATVNNDGSITLPANGTATLGEGDDKITITTPEGGTLTPTADGWTLPAGSSVTIDGKTTELPNGGSLTAEGKLTVTPSDTPDTPETPDTPSTPDPAPPASSNYPVTLPTDLENGSVTVAKEDLWATAGEKITITVTPDAGYMLDELTITDKAGNKVDFTDNGDGTITFTMPAAGVSIDATFVVDPDYEAPSDEPEEPETPTLVEERYTDVTAGAWYRDAVQYVVDNGIMTGTSATTFEPQTATTRAMIVSMLHRLENSPATSETTFSDVAAGSWYADPVAWAEANGIVGGYEDDTFQPNKSITREELASILYRYAEYKGLDTSARADLSIYTDAPSPWAYDVMTWANAEGLITGRTATTIDAQGITTRAECAAIFQRFLG